MRLILAIIILCAVARADTKITWLADVTADRAETVTGAQSNSIAAAAAHIPRIDNPHGVTAPQIGAITNETDSLALSIIATNRTTIVYNPTNSHEWTDGAKRVWRINTVTNTFTGWSVIIETPISICGEIIQPSTNQWPGVPYPLWTDSALSFTQFITNYPAGSTQPMVVWYYYRTGSASPHEVNFSSPAEESSANWHSNYQSASATNSVRVLLGRDDLSPAWSDPVYMVYGTNTIVSVVTSQVATVAWQSDLAPYATTAALAVHTNRADNPHDVTLAGAAAAGGFSGTETITPLNIVMGGYWQALVGEGVSTIKSSAFGASQSGFYYGGIQSIGDDAYGASQSGHNYDGNQSIGAFAYGASQSGHNYDGNQSIGEYAYGASQRGYNTGDQSIGDDAYGAIQAGSVANGATAENNAVGAMQLFDLTSGQSAQTTPGGAASIGLGAVTVSNKNSIVVGDGNVSHGDGSITANSFWQGNTRMATIDDIPEWPSIIAEQDLAALRAYHYGSPDIVESPAEWFVFDGAGTITAFNWEAGRTNVVIPWAIGGVPVTAIGGLAFRMTGIVSVIAPQTVTVIGDYAFAACYSLASVSLPQATAIGDYAFGGCYSLTAVRMGQNAPAEATDVFADITPPPTVYVTDPQATGWGAVWNGAPVVRPPLYGSDVTAQAFTLNGDTITEWPSGSVPYTAWTGTVTPADGTATVAIAHGNMPVLVTSAPCVLTLDPTGYGTAGVSRVSLSYYTGTNSFTFATNIIDYAATPTVDTNGWNTLLIRRVSNGAWKGVGL